MIVSVIGFGHVGSVIASVLAGNRCTVYGIEKNKNLISSFKKLLTHAVLAGAVLGLTACATTEQVTMSNKEKAIAVESIASVASND